MPLTYAALPKRVAAFLLDALMLTPAVLLARESLPLAGTAALLWWAAFEASPWQASPGKKLLGMKTMEASGLRAGFGRALARSALKTLPLVVPGVWPWVAATAVTLSAAGILFDRRRRALHDVLTSTAVIAPPR